MQRADEAEELTPQRPNPYRDALIDSAARALAAQRGIPIEDVLVNSRRYGEIVLERQR